MTDHTTQCVPCALRKDGQAERAQLVEAARGQRLLLAVLSGAENVAEKISTDIESCHECLGRMCAFYLASTAQSVAHLSGSVDAAAEALGRVLGDETA
jgi:hypothetical protein